MRDFDPLSAGNLMISALRESGYTRVEGDWSTSPYDMLRADGTWRIMACGSEFAVSWRATPDERGSFTFSRDGSTVNGKWRQGDLRFGLRSFGIGMAIETIKGAMQ